jgi:hypothetical protein
MFSKISLINSQSPNGIVGNILVYFANSVLICEASEKNS